MNSNFKTIPPFPVSSSRSKKEDKEKEILEVFKKVELNIPLLDAIKQIPKYAKFLKELCTPKRAFKLKGHEMVSMGEVVFAIVQKNMCLKQKKTQVRLLSHVLLVMLVSKGPCAI